MAYVDIYSYKYQMALRLKHIVTPMLHWCLANQKKNKKREHGNQLFILRKQHIIHYYVNVELY